MQPLSCRTDPAKPALSRCRVQQTGNHARGTPTVRPSVNSTHMVTSSNRTELAEMFMPRLHDLLSPCGYDSDQFRLLTPSIAGTVRYPDVRIQPRFRFRVTAAGMDIDGFAGLPSSEK